MSSRIELHFQEGFTGDTVEITVDGRSHARIAPASRMQTGLAHIEALECDPGASIGLRLGSDGPVTRFDADPRRPYVLLNITDGVLAVAYAASSPGYV